MSGTWERGEREGMREDPWLRRRLFLIFLLWYPQDHPAAWSASAQQRPPPPPWEPDAIEGIRSRLNYRLSRRLDELLNATVTPACTDEVAISFEAFTTAHLTETLLPFESPFVESKCPRIRPPLERRVYQKPEDIRILYVMLIHRDANQTMRVIRALQDGDRSQFVVHVDGKVQMPPDLTAFAAKSTNVFIMNEGRVNVTWGGFSVVQATLNAISYGLFLGLEFDRVINLSGTSYPLATPQEIRTTISKYATEDQLMNIAPTPNVPFPKAWHYFVECDNQLHRIARLGLPRGLPLRTGSQWFIISRRFAEYLLMDEDLVTPYMAYARHIIVADENFFSTVLLGSPYCYHHVNENFLYVKFDRWEDEKEDADMSKCLQPDPRFCGRSPVLLTKADVAGLMANNTYLFARKFDGPHASEAMDEIDRILADRRALSGEGRVEEGGRAAARLEHNCLQAPTVAAKGLW